MRGAGRGLVWEKPHNMVKPKLKHMNPSHLITEGNVVAITTGVTAIVTAFFTFLLNRLMAKHKHENTQSENNIQFQAQLMSDNEKFRQQIMAQVDTLTHENEVLRNETEAMQKKYALLVEQYEKAVLEKLEWMEKAVALQTRYEVLLKRLEARENRENRDDS